MTLFVGVFIHSFIYLIDAFRLNFSQEDYKFSVNDATATAAGEIDNVNENLSHRSVAQQPNKNNHKRYRNRCTSRKSNVVNDELYENAQNECPSKIRLFICDICSKRSSMYARLKAHMMRHTGKRPYACDQCDKTFTIPSNLRQHKKNIHK